MIEANNQDSRGPGPAESRDSSTHESIRLAMLQQQGDLSEAEVDAAKARVLGMPATSTGSAGPTSFPATTPNMAPARGSLGCFKAVLWLLVILIVLVASWILYNISQGVQDTRTASTRRGPRPRQTNTASATSGCNDPHALDTAMNILRRVVQSATTDERLRFSAAVGLPVEYPESVNSPVQVYANPDQSLRVCVARMSLPHEVVAFGYSIMRDDQAEDGQHFRLQLLSETEARSGFFRHRPCRRFASAVNPGNGLHTGLNRSVTDDGKRWYTSAPDRGSATPAADPAGHGDDSIAVTDSHTIHRRPAHDGRGRRATPDHGGPSSGTLTVPPGNVGRCAPDRGPLRRQSLRGLPGKGRQRTGHGPVPRR